MKIERIEVSRHKRGRILLIPEEGDILRVTEKELLSFDLYPGRELTEQELEELLKAARRSKTEQTAAHIASARMLSQKELTDRLRRRGAEPEEAAEIAGRMAELGAVDDAVYAGVIARHYAAMGYGRARVEQELFRRGIPKELWEKALAELPDSREAIDRFLTSKCAGRTVDRAERKRLAGALLRRGFSWAEIRPALNRLQGTDGEITEDE